MCVCSVLRVGCIAVADDAVDGDAVVRLSVLTSAQPASASMRGWLSSAPCGCECRWLRLRVRARVCVCVYVRGGSVGWLAGCAIGWRGGVHVGWFADARHVPPD